MVVLIAYFILFPQLSLMRDLRRSIMEGRFPTFVREFMSQLYPDGVYEQWVLNALDSVNIHLLEP